MGWPHRIVHGCSLLKSRFSVVVDCVGCGGGRTEGKRQKSHACDTHASLYVCSCSQKPSYTAPACGSRRGLEGEDLAFWRAPGPISSLGRLTRRLLLNTWLSSSRTLSHGRRSSFSPARFSSRQHEPCRFQAVCWDQGLETGLVANR